MNQAEFLEKLEATRKGKKAITFQMFTGIGSHPVTKKTFYTHPFGMQPEPIGKYLLPHEAVYYRFFAKKNEDCRWLSCRHFCEALDITYKFATDIIRATLEIAVVENGKVVLYNQSLRKKLLKACGLDEHPEHVVWKAAKAAKF